MADASLMDRRDFLGKTGALLATGLASGTAGATTKTFTPFAGGAYYLVVPLSATLEGSYGTTSGESERPVGEDACLPQQIGGCK